MNERELREWIKELINKKELWKFYKCKEWKKVKTDVLTEQKHECQRCKDRGVITRADTVHHVRFVRKYPELALRKQYTYKGIEYRNLIAVCKKCHNELHPEKARKNTTTFTNKELW